MIQIDVKKPGRIPDVGGQDPKKPARSHGVTRPVKVGYYHVAVDDNSRLAYAEVLPDGNGPTRAGSSSGVTALRSGSLLCYSTETCPKRFTQKTEMPSFEVTGRTAPMALR